MGSEGIEQDPWLYRALRVVLNGPFRLLWLKRVEGLENVPTEGPVILASNHESYLDFLLVPVSGCRLPRYLAAEMFFEKPVIGWAFRKMRFIRVDRHNHNNASAVSTALRHLRSGGVIGLFPEGTRSLDGRLQPAQDGVGVLAHISEATVIPVAVVGTFEAWAKGARPRPYPCSVRFGEPLRFSKADYKADKTKAHESTATIMRSIAALAGEEYPW